MKCDRCGEDIYIDEHHIHPKFMDNKVGGGLKINLCRKCHVILHGIIPSLIWKYVDTKQKKYAINCVKKFTDYFIKQPLPQTPFKNENIGLITRCKKCDREIDIEDIQKNFCPFCYSTNINDGDGDDKYN